MTRDAAPPESFAGPSQERPGNDNGVGPFSGIRARLMLAFGSVTVLAIVLGECIRLLGIPPLGIEGSIHTLRSHTLQTLSETADHQRSRLREWLKERRLDALTLAQSPAIGRMAVALADEVGRAGRAGEIGPAYWKAHREKAGVAELTRELLTLSNGAPETYRGVSIVDIDSGHILASSRDEAIGKLPLMGGAFFEAARAPGQIETVDILHSPIDDHDYLAFAHQLFARDASGNLTEPRAIVILATRIENIPLAREARKDAGTEETILINHDQRILSPLRHPLPDGRRAVVNVDRLDTPLARLAASGAEGFASETDYRGQRALVAYRHVLVSSDLGLGILVTQEEGEALTPLYAELRQRAGLSLFLLVFLLAVVALVTRRLSAPIARLAETAHAMETGDLAARTGLRQGDEIGRLAATFDKMAERVQQWHATLSQEVGARTHQLERANRLYQALSETNQLIVHEQDRERLFASICRVAVEHGRFRAACIQLSAPDERFGPAIYWNEKSDDEGGDCVEVSCAGEGDPRCGMSEICSGLNGRLIINDVDNDAAAAPYRATLLGVGLHAIATFPLGAEGVQFGTFTVASDETDAFTEREVALLSEMADDIGFAVHTHQMETRRAAAEAGLHASERSRRVLSYAVEQGPSGVVITNPSGEIEYVNAKFLETSGYTEAECLGRNPRFLKSGAVPTDTYRMMWATILNGGIWRGEMCNRRKDGSLYWVSSSVGPLRDDDGAVRHYVQLAEDVTLRKQYEAQLVRQAHYDELTGLPNRLLALDRMIGAIARAARQGEKLAILFIDLDNFKQVNDTLGHAVGDELLKLAATRLAASIREVDTLSRLGGDEFLVMLTDIEDSTATDRVARQIVETFGQPFQVDEHEIYTTVSVGITLCPDDGNTPGTLMRNADAAMYLAKNDGRNVYRFFSMEIAHQSERRLNVETRLRRALERGEFYPVYQPILDLASGLPIGAEVLLRWNCPELNPIYPDEFIVVAEDTGLIVPIGEHVLRQACAEAVQWRGLGAQAQRVAVNVSARQFRHGDFAALVERTLADTGLPPALLEIEITERVVVDDAGQAARVLDRLRTLGIRVSMDDFGTGYSSLSYLHDLPIDTLKIDRSFVSNILNEAQDASLTEAIIAIGRSLGLEVLAEGVEEAGQLEFLQRHGCDLAQGYYFSRPIPAEEYRAWLRENLPQ